MTEKYILLIEDNKGISDSLVWALEYEHYSIVAKTNGQEAVEYLNVNSKPGLILLDMMMPIMDGWLFREIQHANPELSNIPTILMSARSNFAKSLVVFPNEVLLSKPFDINDLLAMIKTSYGLNTELVS